MLGIVARHFPNDPRTQEELKRGVYRLSVLDEAQALLDIPVAPYFAQFDRIYPDAKFIQLGLEIGERQFERIGLIQVRIQKIVLVGGVVHGNRPGRIREALPLPFNHHEVVTDR